MKKKLVTTLLGASLLLAACGGEKAAEKPATAEAETIKIGASWTINRRSCNLWNISN